MTGTLDDQASAARLLAVGRAGTLLPAPFRGGQAGTGQFPQPGQLGLQLPGFLLQLQDPADAGQVQPVGGQRADLGQLLDVPAGAARAARRSSSPSRS